MKKYKLIKWYPSLPKNWKIGMIVGMGDRNWGYSPISSIEYNKCLDNNEVENNPEFWEKVESPLFITKDNISKYFGDTYYYIVENDRGIIPHAWEILEGIITWQNPEKSPLGKVNFHDLKKAEQYIKENKPQYSEKDMLSFGKYIGGKLSFSNPENDLTL